MGDEPFDFSKYKPCVAKERRDGSVYISFGNPVSGPHYQCDFGDFFEIAEAVAEAFNSHDFPNPDNSLTPP